MKNVSSRPPIFSYTSRESIMNDPLTASTGYVSSGLKYVRLYLPKMRDCGNIALNPNAFAKETQGVGKLLLHASWNEPSGFRTLQPARPTSGFSWKNDIITRKVSS